MFPNGEFACKAIISGEEMTFSVHADIKKIYILILGEGPTQKVNGTSLTAAKRYSINFTKARKTFFLSLRYNGLNSYLFVSGT